MDAEIEKAALRDRVVVITGAGRGIGAAYAKTLARLGASVVVNDVGGSLNGEATGETPAQQLVDEIVASGGTALADSSDISSFEQAANLVKKAVQTFGKLDVLINNAGIMRDRMLVNMSEQEWDDVVRVHLKGHFCTTRHAAAHWRERAKSGRIDAVLIQTSSISGLHGNIGQFNYSTVKSAVAQTARLAHLELHLRYGVRSYAIAPGARTRLTLSSPGAVEHVQKKIGDFDFFDPDNVAPFVAWLAAENCSAPSGSIYGVEGDLVRRYNGWSIAETIRNGGKRWTLDELDRRSAELNRGAEEAFTPVEEVLKID